jgi:hypothetical protein
MPVIVYVYRHPRLDVMVAFVRNSCSSIVVCGTLPVSWGGKFDGSGAAVDVTW